jgi:hypothetical protein
MALSSSPVSWTDMPSYAVTLPPLGMLSVFEPCLKECARPSRRQGGRRNGYLGFPWRWPVTALFVARFLPWPLEPRESGGFYADTKHSYRRLALAALWIGLCSSSAARRLAFAQRVSKAYTWRTLGWLHLDCAMWDASRIRHACALEATTVSRKSFRPCCLRWACALRPTRQPRYKEVARLVIYSQGARLHLLCSMTAELPSRRQLTICSLVSLPMSYRHCPFPLGCVFQQPSLPLYQCFLTPTGIEMRMVDFENVGLAFLREQGARLRRSDLFAHELCRRDVTLSSYMRQVGVENHYVFLHTLGAFTWMQVANR